MTTGYLHEHRVTREDRERLGGHAGCVVWFTGLSGSGKSTIGNLADGKLNRRACGRFCWMATTSVTV